MQKQAGKQASNPSFFVRQFDLLSDGCVCFQCACIIHKCHTSADYDHVEVVVPDLAVISLACLVIPRHQEDE